MLAGITEVAGRATPRICQKLTAADRILEAACFTGRRAAEGALQ